MCNYGVGIYASMHGAVVSKGYYIKEYVMYMEKERQRYHLTANNNCALSHHIW